MKKILGIALVLIFALGLNFLHAAYVAPSSGGVFFVTTHLTSSQILNSNTSPVLVIPGVPGKTIFVLGANFAYTPVSANYTAIGNSGAAYEGELNSGASLVADINQMSYYDATHTWSQSPNNYARNSSLSATDLIGKGIVFKTDSANPAGGNGTGDFTVFYQTY